MTTRWKSMLRLSSLALILVITAMPTRLQAQSVMPLPRTNPGEDRGPLPRCRDAAIPQGAASRDRVYLGQDVHSIVVNVYHVTGVGSMLVHPPAIGWPAAVTVRLHHFPVLEGFSARAPAATLTCEQSRPEGIAARLDCRLAEVQIDAITREPEYFEVSLPQTLLEGANPVEIHWVDQWR
jgi:hypothetical protein